MCLNSLIHNIFYTMWRGCLIWFLGQHDWSSLVTAQLNATDILVFSTITIVYKIKGRRLTESRKTAWRQCQQRAVRWQPRCDNTQFSKLSLLLSVGVNVLTARGKLGVKPRHHVSSTQQSGSSDTCNYCNPHPRRTSTRRSIHRLSHFIPLTWKLR
jgi:hypothetical protein